MRKSTMNSSHWEDVIRELEDRLRSRLGNRIRDLKISHGSGGLILHGHAHTYHAKQLAQHTLMKISDIRVIGNEIAVT